MPAGITSIVTGIETNGKVIDKVTAPKVWGWFKRYSEGVSNIFPTAGSAIFD